MKFNLSGIAKDIILGGWGEDILMGALIDEISMYTTKDIYEQIKSKAIISNIPESAIGDFRKAAKNFNLDTLLATENILSRVGRHRPDLVSIVINHPDGISWLETNIQNVKSQLNGHKAESKWIMSPENESSK